MNRRGLLLAALLLTAVCVATAAAAGHGGSGSPATASCGTAAIGGPNHASTASGSASLRCFALAVTRCQAASISVTEFGVDGGVEITATVEPGTPCRARYVHNSYSANFGGSTGPKRTTHCTVTATSSNVSFGCPDLSDDIPTS